jgi:kumamolisin
MSRKLFHDSVLELPPQPGLTATGFNVHAAQAQHDDEVMQVHFSLSPDGQANEELEALVEKGETLPLAELNAKYGVSKPQVQPLLDWLKKQHFVVTSVSPDHTSIYANAKAGDVAKALQVELVRVTSDGITYTSARNAPSLPDSVAANVRAIGGLQPHRQAHKHARRCPPPRRLADGTAGIDAQAKPHAVQPPGYRPAQLMKAYGADGLHLSGKGQTIAIIIDAPPKDADMQSFWKLCGIPHDGKKITVVNVNEAELPPPTGEETLDAQWASGIATGAKVTIYATGSLAFTDIDKALDRVLLDAASDPGLRQVSMSLGLGEAYMAPGEVKTEHAKFLRLAAAGINVFVSSGDAGSNPDATGHHAGGPLQAEYESSDPCVVGVGGTTLKLAANGSVVKEVGWRSGGGGKSRFFKRPAWQAVPGGGSSRMVPDVSLTADPNYGGLVVLDGQPAAYGGTSWSAPAWAGFCALINEARVAAGKKPLPFLNPLIYRLQGTDAFRDITAGSNGAYDSAAGYDMVTGLGVPNVKALISHLNGV